MADSKYCSFCGREGTSLNPLLEGMEANICGECIETCVEEFLSTNYVNRLNKILKPHEIKAELDKHVVGQEEAKRILSVAVYNHYKRNHVKSKIDIQKSNILMIGPTGSGKTYIIQTLAKILDVPLVIADATSLTQAGYVGDDVESLLEKLVIKARGDIQKAEQGIVYIDEIDKIASYDADSHSRYRDVSGQGVQESLLKIIEDSEVHLHIGSHPIFKQRIIINTKNILFICGGAFVGLGDIVKKRITGKSKQLGFTADHSSDLTTEEKEITHQDLIDFGFIPEFVGRFPIIATLNPLSKVDMINILKSAILKQYQELFRMDGVKLKFHKNAIEYIAEEALRKKVGARGLKGIIERKMYDLMFEIPQHNDINSFVITKEMLMNKKKVSLQ